MEGCLVKILGVTRRKAHLFTRRFPEDVSGRQNIMSYKKKKKKNFLGGFFWVITDYNFGDGTQVKAVYETHYVLCRKKKNVISTLTAVEKHLLSPQGHLAGLPPHPIISTRCGPPSTVPLQNGLQLHPAAL